MLIILKMRMFEIKIYFAILTQEKVAYRRSGKKYIKNNTAKKV